MTTKELVQELTATLTPYPKGRVFNDFRLADYLGTPREVYKIPTAELRKLVKTFNRSHPDLPKQALSELLTQLFQGENGTERGVASLILAGQREFRENLDLKLLEGWLDHLIGWSEIDGLCQSTFTAHEILARWPEWKKLFAHFVKSKNISQRRASLVLLTRSVRESNDERLAKIAFNHIEQLESERDILITKAISWLLRELIHYHRSLVEGYLKTNQETLPKIAIREVSRKLLTGKK